MNELVLTICRSIAEAGGRALLVGGWVRDRLAGLESKDFDLEVYNLDAARVKQVIESIGHVNTVGEHFAVYKLTPRRPDRGGRPDQIEVDISLPRRESKSGRGHRGFLVEGDPFLSFEEASRRRDFTVNAILYDPLADEIIDPMGGAADFQKRVLRAVSETAFIEDSLRVLRAVQLAARFEMTLEPATADLCRAADLSDLPRERVWGELEKMLLARRPSKGLYAALDLRVLEKLFPEIQRLVGCPQEPEWHPEGDVFTHTALCIDEAAGLISDLPRPKKIAVMLATLCHDLGKPGTTSVVEGRVRSLGHDQAGIEPTLAVMERLGIYSIAGYDVRSQVLALVREHLRPGQLYRERENVTNGALRRLARRVDLELLYRVAKADALGRGPGSSAEAQEWVIEKARELGVDRGAPAPILMGRHLLEIGIEPGPRMGEILERVYELQLDDQVRTIQDALAAAQRLSGKPD